MVNAQQQATNEIAMTLGLNIIEIANLKAQLQVSNAEIAEMKAQVEVEGQ